VGLVASCHLAAGAETATFSTPELKNGLFPLMVFTLAAPRAGSKLTFEMALCGRVLTAREAVAAGLLNAAVPAHELDALVGRWVRRIGEWDGDVVAAGLAALHATGGTPLVKRVRACQAQIDAMDARRRSGGAGGRMP